MNDVVSILQRCNSKSNCLRIRCRGEDEDAGKCSTVASNGEMAWLFAAGRLESMSYWNSFAGICCRQRLRYPASV